MKELSSIVDYSKGQYAAAINEDFFAISSFLDPDGGNFYSYFLASTTLLDGVSPGDAAEYISHLVVLWGILNDTGLVDAHGAGAMRGDPNDYPANTTGFQGDVQYVFNYVREVRNISE